MADRAGVIGPGGTLGIIGGGQLGRMLALAAARLGIRCAILEPQADCPAAQVAWKHIAGAYDDPAALDALAAVAGAVTYEFENVPGTAADHLAALVPVRPGAQALRVAQDRLSEKTFLNAIGVETAPFAAVDDAESLAAAMAAIGTPAVLKTRRMGYDGKGQAKIATPAGAPAALAAMKGAPSILEGFIAFEREVSVIVARGADGTVACFDPVENVHRDHILHTSTVPAAIGAATATAALKAASDIVTALEYVGVMGVELFVRPDGSILANEIAPRVHNSGHWTQDAALTCQFEQHVRAVCGWPLGSAARHSDVVMTNLIGAEADAWADLAAEPGTRIHLYGKADARPGRKMGHVNRLVRTV